MAPDDGTVVSGEGMPAQVRVLVAANPAPGTALEESLTLVAGSTIADALAASGLLLRYPALQSDLLQTGIWGRLQPRSTVLRDGDRVELYRPLAADPKDARRARAREQRKTTRRAAVTGNRRRSRPALGASRRRGPRRRGTRVRPGR